MPTRNTPLTSNLPLIRPGIEITEYKARRERVLKSLNGSAAIVLSGDGGGHGGGAYKADSFFVYLTGITTEPGAAVLFNPQSEDPRRRIVLFLKPLNPELERWDRYRDPISAQMKSAAGFEVVMRTDSLPTLFTSAARRCKKLACLHPFGTSGPGADLQMYRKVAERVVGVSIEDRSMLLSEMRSVKSKAELAIMRKAAEATAAGYAAVLDLFNGKKVGGAKTEKHVERTLTSTYLDHGADGHAYDPIVGSGLNATVLHYRDNAGPLTPGDLLLIDSGCQFQGYACDVTRTFPTPPSGRFTPEQKKTYQVVLDAQLAAIKKAKPGVYLWELDKAARDIIEKAGFGDAYIHGIGHHLGMDVHDASPDGPLQPGMVITIEPGIYLPERNLGIRIEDDILITSKGNENLTKMIPKTIEDVEAAMR